MSSRVEQLKTRFEGLSKREQYIVLGGIFVVLVFLWDALLFAPLQRDSERIKKQINELNSSLANQSGELVRISAEASNDPNAALRVQQQNLVGHLQGLDQQAGQLTDNLIRPQQMTQVLEQVLGQQPQGRLRLVKVASVPAKQVTAGVEANQGEAEEDSALYRHGFEIQLEGNYFDTLEYLQLLEQLPWRVLWNGLEYQVQEYPKAKIKLRINTLSTDEDWIGV